MRFLRVGLACSLLFLALSLVVRGQDATQPPAEKSKQPESLDSIIAKGWRSASARDLRPHEPVEQKEMNVARSPAMTLSWLLEKRQYAKATVFLAKLPKVGVEEASARNVLWESLGRSTKYDSVEDYWIILNIIRKREEKELLREQTLQDFLDRFDYLNTSRSANLWFLNPAQSGIREKMTERERKAVRAWAIKMIVTCGEKAAATGWVGPEDLKEREKVLYSFPYFYNTYLKQGSPYPLDKFWVEWYGEPLPDEFSRLRTLVEEGVQMHRDALAKMGRQREAEEKGDREKRREESPIHNPERFK